MTSCDGQLTSPMRLSMCLLKLFRCRHSSSGPKSWGGTLTCAAFLTHRFRPAKMLPWSLCGANKCEKWRAVALGERPAAGVGQQIYDLVSIDYPESELTEALELLDEVDWAIASTEQGHRHASAIARAHEGYCAKTMQARAMLGQFAVLLPVDETKGERAKVLRQLQRLEARRPQSLQGRQEFVSGLSSLLQQRKCGKLADMPVVWKKY